MIGTILSWIIIGFIVGLIARAIMPGRQSLGFWKTTGLGVAGALVGGLVFLAIHRWNDFIGNSISQPTLGQDGSCQPFVLSSFFGLQHARAEHVIFLIDRSLSGSSF